MTRKKLAIVSSYNTLCGNATYTHVLKQEFAKHYDTDVLALEHETLANAHPQIIPIARDHVADLAEKLRGYDYVNIQFEIGLFGYSYRSAIANVLPLVEASRNLIFTIHRLFRPQWQRPLWKSILRNGRNLQQSMRDIQYQLESKAYPMLVNAVKERAADKPTAFLVHTKKDASVMQTFYGAQNVIDFPITFLNKQQISEHVLNKKRIRAEVMDQYGLDPSAKYIGLFGFLSENKGHHIALDALKYLPQDYRVLIFGCQHPGSIREYDLSAMQRKPALFHQNNNPYISSLVELAAKINTESERVLFLGAPSDADFIRAITAVDFVVVPYFETGQSGSGNASLILELGTPAIFSRSKAFEELNRYYEDCFTFSDIGNPMEIAHNIKNWRTDRSAALKKALEIYNIENNILKQKAFFETGSMG